MMTNPGTNTIGGPLDQAVREITPTGIVRMTQKKLYPSGIPIENTIDIDVSLLLTRPMGPSVWLTHRSQDAFESTTWSPQYLLAVKPVGPHLISCLVLYTLVSLSLFSSFPLD
jgi:hypothetical protein